MADMDQTTMMALAATGVAVVGAAVLYATTNNTKPPPPPKKKTGKAAKAKRKKKAAKAAAPEPEPESVTEDDSSDQAPTPTKKKKKNKRKHKGRKKKSGKKGGANLHEDDQGKFHEDDSASGDDWVTKVAKPKKKRSQRKDQDSDSEGGREKTPSINMDVGQCVPAIIGKGGKTIQNLQETTGARLNIEKGSSNLNISGTPGQIAEAKNMVDAIIKQCIERDGERATRAARVPPAATHKIDDLGDAVGLIIGKGGSTIRGIQEETGAKLDISRDDDSLTISGSKEEVAAAVERVTALIASRKEGRGGGGGGGGSRPPIMGDASAVVDLETKRGMFTVIGKGGSKIRQIESESGARVGIDKETNICTINGTDEQVAMAKAMVEDCVSGSAQSSIRVDLTKDKIGSIIGRGGSTIRRISEETGARLDISRTDDCYVTIMGSDEACEAARKEVEKVLAEAASSGGGGGRGPRGPQEGEVQFTIELGEAVGSVIGRGGETIRRIQDESGARLNIERSTSSCNIIGDQAAVDAATEAVQAILTKQAEGGGGGRGPRGPREGEVQFTIDLGDSVGSVIGRGGETIRRIQDESGARLNIERSSSSCNIIGDQDAVDAATEAVQAILDSQADGGGGGRGPRGPKEGEVQFNIDLGEAVGLVIGRGGETIRRIQDESGARLNIERSDSSCNIIGDQAAVDAATEAVQAILDSQNTAVGDADWSAQGGEGW